MHGVSVKVICKKLNFSVYLTHNLMLQPSVFWHPANCYKFIDVSGGGGMWALQPVVGGVRSFFQKGGELDIIHRLR